VDGTDHYRDLSIKCELNIFTLYRKRIDSSEKCARIKKKRILDTRDLSKVDETTGSRFICLAFLCDKGEEWICLMLLLLVQE
jgi:ubiquitin C-terminal hydrolase